MDVAKGPVAGLAGVIVDASARVPVRSGVRRAAVGWACIRSAIKSSVRTGSAVAHAVVVSAHVHARIDHAVFAARSARHVARVHACACVDVGACAGVVALLVDQHDRLIAHAGGPALHARSRYLSPGTARCAWRHVARVGIAHRRDHRASTRGAGWCLDFIAARARARVGSTRHAGCCAANHHGRGTTRSRAIGDHARAAASGCAAVARTASAFVLRHVARLHSLARVGTVLHAGTPRAVVVVATRHTIPVAGTHLCVASVHLHAGDAVGCSRIAAEDGALARLRRFVVAGEGLRRRCGVVIAGGKRTHRVATATDVAAGSGAGLHLGVDFKLAHAIDAATVSNVTALDAHTRSGCVCGSELTRAPVGNLVGTM